MRKDMQKIEGDRKGPRELASRPFKSPGLVSFPPQSSLIDKRSGSVHGSPHFDSNSIDYNLIKDEPEGNEAPTEDEALGPGSFGPYPADRFSNLRALKSSFAFLENSFLVGILKNGCLISPSISRNIVAVKLKLRDEL
ncbi:hypothetical protein TNCV_2595921 [Trichonephila clavipes]|nr:hypothetical protein TNCV_2595921 [Trichonephila clavipes]